MTEGTVLLGHGSRAPEAREALGVLARRLELMDGRPVVPASLAFNHPTFEEAVAELVGRGCVRVGVVPLFLYSGIHLQKDLPRLVEVERRRYPQVELRLAHPIGPDPLLDSILLARLSEALGVRAAGKLEKSPDLPQAIERRSFNLVDQALWPEETSSGRVDGRREVIRRMVHASGDLGLAGLVRMNPESIDAGVAALRRGCPVACDVEMVRAGMDARRLDRLGCSVLCLLNGASVAEEASSRGKTRTALALARALALAPQSLVVVGNAPTALEEVCDLVESGEAFPPLIIGIPVGFVGARESKHRLASLGVPYITVEGSRGGSSLAAAALNALLRLALPQLPLVERQERRPEAASIPMGNGDPAAEQSLLDQPAMSASLNGGDDG